LLESVLDNYDESLVDAKSDLMQIISSYDSLEKPAKLEYLLKLVGELREKNLKVVVWSHFRGTLKLITSYLSQNGFICKLIFGDTPIEQTAIAVEETREMIREEFIDPNSNLNILIANPAACGESISLHKTCYHAIYYDLSYNCAQYLQSLDRIHRVGGSEINQANYYFLQYRDSIDEDILTSLQKKSAKMLELIEQDYGIYSLDMFEEDGEIEAYDRLYGPK
jgi:SNF2 family DNA or RNA helicase